MAFLEGLKIRSYQLVRQYDQIDCGPASFNIILQYIVYIQGYYIYLI